VSALLDWLEYRDDNKNVQAQEPQQLNPYYYPQALFPSSVFPPQQPSFNPQAVTFEPSYSSVPQYNSVSAYRVDKHSQRYDLRQRNDSQLRPYTTGAARQSPRSTQYARRRSQSPPAPAAPAAPAVTVQYASGSCLKPKRLPKPQKLLVILDLNGTLIARNPENREIMKARPGVSELLSYLFANHVVMVCTSATRRSANLMLLNLLTKQQWKQLVTIRARETFQLSKAEFHAKTQIFKNLAVIWKDPLVMKATPQGAHPWSLRNTVLIDDSVLKAAAQPHNLLEVPEFEWADAASGSDEVTKREVAVMQDVRRKLDHLSLYDNAASIIRTWQEEAKASAENAGVKESTGADNYPTPTSLQSETASTEENHESEDEYEPPEAVELVFRGRKNMASQQMKPKSREQGENVPRRRGASPVTEDHFSWMKKDECNV
jgi:hypothetical protein